MLNLLLIGPQGSGKGTQAENIVNTFHLTHIEAGSLIRSRAEKHDRKSEIIDHLVNKKGQLLPDGVVLDMIYDELAEKPSLNGYLFDGFPRTIKQYEALKDMLADKDTPLTAAIYLHIPDEESISRLSSRRLCQTCKRGYSLAIEPNRQNCDCGGTLVKRPDDEPDAIKKRLELFHQSTQPILDMLKKDNLLIEIDGSQPISTIADIINQQLHQLNQ